MASTDIDGTPILILRPEQARLILEMAAYKFWKNEDEQALLAKVEAFLKEASNG